MASANLDDPGVSRRRLLTSFGTATLVSAAGVRPASADSVPGPRQAQDVPVPVATDLDYAWAPYPSVGAMTAAGYAFAIRYLSYSPAKNLTADEARALATGGIAVVCNWEATADGPRQGFGQGRRGRRRGAAAGGGVRDAVGSADLLQRGLGCAGRGHGRGHRVLRRRRLGHRPGAYRRLQQLRRTRLAAGLRPDPVGLAVVLDRVLRGPQPPAVSRHPAVAEPDAVHLRRRRRGRRPGPGAGLRAVGRRGVRLPGRERGPDRRRRAQRRPGRAVRGDAGRRDREPVPSRLRTPRGPAGATSARRRGSGSPRSRARWRPVGTPTAGWRSSP